MSIVMRVVCRADGGPTPEAGLFVKSFDVDARDGRGVGQWAVSPLKAMHFENAAEALVYWRRQSTVVPYRNDGLPNRPLTSLSVELLNVDEIALH